MMEKFVQITTGMFSAYDEQQEDERQQHVLYALDEAGGVWRWDYNDSYWKRIPLITDAPESQMTGKARDAQDTERQ
jgi:hypothetical protein